MKKPATGRAAVPAKKAAPVKSAPKKPAAKKPSPAAAAAHKAHLAHLAHLAHTGHPKAAPKKKRQLALGDDVACCSAEAVAASLRLTGRPVPGADVLALYRRTASDPDAGATIAATLEAAAEYGLAGVRPLFADMEKEQDFANLLRPAGCDYSAANPAPSQTVARTVILGLDLPGSHAVLATADGWWSWGELYDPDCWPDAVIEEAWTLTWT